MEPFPFSVVRSDAAPAARFEYLSPQQEGAMERWLRWVSALLFTLSAGACDLVGESPEMGFWIGVIVGVVVVVLIIWALFQLFD